MTSAMAEEWQERCEGGDFYVDGQLVWLAEDWCDWAVIGHTPADHQLREIYDERHVSYTLDMEARGDALVEQLLSTVNQINEANQ